ncbi:MAG: SNF2-related protein [Coraliomargaritaceae bacterium]
MDKSPPLFDRAFCLDLAGGRVYQQAEKLFESHAVESAEWKSPLLVGIVKGANDRYRVQLNLRSTVFVENNCSCLLGRKGKMCAHAIAACLHFQALQGEARVQAAADEANADSVASTAKTSLPGLQTIRLSDDGTALRLLVFLPPNLPQAAERNAIVVKVDAAAGRSVIPVHQLNRSTPYSVSEGQKEVLSLIESWCGGVLGGILELSKAQLVRLLSFLEDEPVIYWVKNPARPILWQDGQLEGVHELLQLSPTEKAEAARAEERLRSEREPASPIRIEAKTQIRERSKTNRRRMIEAQAGGLFRTTAADYPGVINEEPMDDYPDNRIVVDGSSHFLAVRLPREDDSIAPLRQILKSEGFQLEPSNRKWWLRDRHKTLNFLAEHLRTLKDNWRAILTDPLERNLKTIQFSEFDIVTREEDGGFMLEVRLSGEKDEMDLRKAISTGKNYVDHSDGKITLLDRSSVDRLHALEKAVSGQADRPFTPTFSKRLSTAELVDVEDLMDEMCEGWQAPQAWQSRSQALKQVGALEPAPVREEFNRILRTYQCIGVAWLWHLYRNELGGILADEMGLGKTLQALALIECIREANQSGYPALVVCPASLVENWMREASRFTPGLKTLKHHGPKRAKESVVLEDFDLIITSYGTLRQDADLMGTMDWCVVIGDEAQHIKNRRSQNARALTSLRSQGRFLLTGTPVENSLEDLLSLFSFIMPGYLQKSEGKLSTDDRVWQNQRQSQRAAAYILRRTKKEVAPELPDKIEKTFFCELGSQQTRFYQDTLEKTRKEIFELEMGGANAGRVQFAAFKELLRLRQVCVDPRILDENFAAAESAKLAAFEEILDECLDAGSRILVFSSFVSALKLLAEYLKSKGHRYCYLDGSTKNRLTMCDTFNADASIPVFLISLKAGGTGLNLTGADTVVHYDPWWNPAAEAQATDRAHRIGQKKVVTSIKLIAANTVEEKVVELQAKKAELLDELFAHSAEANAKVSLDTIKSLLE